MARRLIAAFLCLCMTLGCSSRVTRVVVYPSPLEENDRIVGVTREDGVTIRFPDGGWIEGDVVRSSSYSIEGEEMRSSFEIPLSETTHLWIERKETSAGKTTAVVVSVFAATLVVGVAVLAASSCPFVYSWDGEQYIFDAEPFGGAVTRGLERDDYSELEHLVPGDGKYSLQVTNEVPETQYTNLMELWLADHAGGTRVVADEDGTLHALRSEEPPIEARDDSGRDLLPWLEAKDRSIWEPPAVPRPDGSVRDDIILTFPKPEGATRATLVARVATGFWGSQMIRETLELRGRAVNDWYRAIDEDANARGMMELWNLREELFRLKIAVEGPLGWEVAGNLPGGGPYLTEDRAVSLDISEVPGDRLRLRLRPPVGFWALDYFAVSYDPEDTVTPQVLPVLEAVTPDGDDVRGFLLAEDDDYFVMPEIGDRAQVTFAAPPTVPGLERSFFLHSRGYYRLHLEEMGDPDLETLKQIAEIPDATARYSARRYQEAVTAEETDH